MMSWIRDDKIDYVFREKMNDLRVYVDLKAKVQSVTPSSVAEEVYIETLEARINNELCKLQKKLENKLQELVDNKVTGIV